MTNKTIEIKVLEISDSVLEQMRERNENDLKDPKLKNYVCCWCMNTSIDQVTWYKDFPHNIRFVTSICPLCKIGYNIKD